LSFFANVRNRNQMDYVSTLNKSIKKFFLDALKVSAKSPGIFFHILKTIKDQNNAIRKRLKWERKGLHVPPFMIISVTDRCNLECTGCYYRLQDVEVDR